MPEQDEMYRADLMSMSDEDFAHVWELIVGERPAIVIERGRMIDLLRASIPMEHAGPDSRHA